MSEQLDKIIATGLIIALVFAALAHGAVEPWSVAIFELIVLALVILWAVKAFVDKRVVVNVPALIAPLAGLIALGLAQSVVVTDGAGGRLSLSIDVEATRSSVTVLIVLSLAALVAANFWGSRDRLNLLHKVLTTYGLALAVFGLVQYFAWDGRLFWLRQTPADEVTSPFGPFISHSHFSGYLELLIPIPIAMLITRGVGREARLFYGFAAVMMGMAILASLSRGGMIALAAQMILLAVAGRRLARRHESELWSMDYPGNDALNIGESVYTESHTPVPRSRSRAWTVGIIVSAIALGIIWIGPAPLVNRVTQGKVTSSDPKEETFFLSRGWVWRDTLSMIRANPVAGVGLGAFETAFPNYSRGDGSLKVSQAHNDYLQVLADGGLIGGALVVWFLVAFRRSFARAFRSRSRLQSGLALGAGASATGMLVHSIFDFNLQLPAHALLFLLLLTVISHVAAAAEPAASLAGPAEARREALVSAAGN